MIEAKELRIALTIEKHNTNLLVAIDGDDIGYGEMRGDDFVFDNFNSKFVKDIIAETVREEIIN